jgi:FMN phosphatase YigB (HAD superfamily)
MVRAIFFDFYSVWTPDKFSYYLANAQLSGPEVSKELYDTIEQYYHGQIDVDYLAGAIRYKLGHPDVTAEALYLSEANVSPDIANLIRALHGHFIKIGILANLGAQEAKLLNDFNQRNQLFEVIASPLSFGTNLPLLSQPVFAQALQAIGEPPASCLFISGNPYFLAFAANLGISTLQFEGLSRLQESLNQILASEMPA